MVSDTSILHQTILILGEGEITLRLVGGSWFYGKVITSGVDGVIFEPTTGGHTVFYPWHNVREVVIRKKEED